MIHHQKRSRSGDTAEPSTAVVPDEQSTLLESMPLPLPWEHVCTVIGFVRRIANASALCFLWLFVCLLRGKWQVYGAPPPPPREWAEMAAANQVRSQERMRADLANPRTRRWTVVAFWFAVASVGMLGWSVMHPL